MVAILIAGAAGAPAEAKPRSGTTSADFVGKSVGARFVGKGETGAADVGGPQSPVWNPASLHDLSGPTFSADFDLAYQSKLDEDVVVAAQSLRGRKLTYLGFAGPDAAFFFRPLANFSDRTITDPTDPDGNYTEKSLSIYQVGVSAANVASEDNYTIGVNLSYLNAHLGTATAATGQPPALNIADGNGFTFDLGLRARSDALTGGLAFFNIPGILYWNDYKADQLPVLMRTGAAFHPKPFATVTADYEKRFYRGGVPQPDFIHLGLELTPLEGFQLRGGTYGDDLSNTEKTFYTMGFSLASPKKQQVDFALRTYKMEGEKVYNYYVSLVLPLPNIKEEKSE